MNTYQRLFDLTGKIAIVTGSAGILGSAFCEGLCSMGAKVACFDLPSERLEAQQIELRKQFGEETATSYSVDVSSPEEVERQVQRVVNDFGKIDILLNNAATKGNNVRDFFTDFEKYSLALWREIMSVNIDGMFLMVQAAGKQMLKQQSGAILQTASMYSDIAPDQRIYEGSDYLGGPINTPAVYTTSKAGVLGMTKHLAALWGDKGIRVNAICPGGIGSGQNNTFAQKYSARVPLGRMASTTDIVGPMLFLVSDAAQYVTGQVFYADGGLSAW